MKPYDDTPPDVRTTLPCVIFLLHKILKCWTVRVPINHSVARLYSRYSQLQTLNSHKNKTVNTNINGGIRRPTSISNSRKILTQTF